MSSSRSTQVKRLDIIGGVYRERCRFPRLDDVYGSGGRAAAVAAGLGATVTLHTVAGEALTPHLRSQAEVFDYQLDIVAGAQDYSFLYDHPLSTPSLEPTPKPPAVHISVKAKCALIFGMVDATAQVEADRIVYDPQNPRAPQPYNSADLAHERLAYVLNGAEAHALSREEDPKRAARTIAREHNATTVVIKRGPHGALVFDRGRFHDVPCYRTDRISPIGSGDVFVSTFAVKWACEGLAAEAAATIASKAAAIYVNDRVLPIPKDSLVARKFRFDVLTLSRRLIKPSEYHVYLAAPFFSTGQLWLLEEARYALKAVGLKVFSPLHDAGIGVAHDVVPVDIAALNASRCLFALVDGLDSGTLYEVGYARALKKPVIAFAESCSDQEIKMLVGTDCDVQSDFATSIYRASWSAR